MWPNVIALHAHEVLILKVSLNPQWFSKAPEIQKMHLMWKNVSIWAALGGGASLRVDGRSV